VPSSRLNQIRRAVIREAEKRLEKLRKERAGRIISEICVPAVKGGEKTRGDSPGTIYIKTDNPENLGMINSGNSKGIKEIILDISKIEATRLWTDIPLLEHIVGEGNVRLALPPITRAWEKEELKWRIKNLLEKGYTKWQISNLSGFEFLKEGQTGALKIRISADWPLYVTNHLAAKNIFSLGIQKVTLAPENSLENLKELSRILGEKSEAIIHQDTPLFISESCPKAAMGGRCRGEPSCDFGQITVESEKLGKFIIVSDNCRTVVVDEEAFDMIDKIREMKKSGASKFRLDFINKSYRPAETAEILETVRMMVEKGEKAPSPK